MIIEEQKSKMIISSEYDEVIKTVRDQEVFNESDNTDQLYSFIQCNDFSPLQMKNDFEIVSNSIVS